MLVPDASTLTRGGCQYVRRPAPGCGWSSATSDKRTHPSVLSTVMRAPCLRFTVVQHVAAASSVSPSKLKGRYAHACRRIEARNGELHMYVSRRRYGCPAPRVGKASRNLLDARASSHAAQSAGKVLHTA